MQLRVNQRLELHVAGSSFPVRVEEVGDGRVVLTAPLDGSRPVFPAPGSRVRGRLYQDGGAWEFEGTVEGCARGPVETVCVRLLGPLRQVDRRTVPRRPVTLKAFVARVDHLPPKLTPAEVVDVSEGGCQLEVRNVWPELSVGERLLVTVSGRSPAALAGRVVWVQPRFERGRTFAVGVAWTAEASRLVRRMLDL